MPFCQLPKDGPTVLSIGDNTADDYCLTNYGLKPEGGNYIFHDQLLRSNVQCQTGEIFLQAQKIMDKDRREEFYNDVITLSATARPPMSPSEWARQFSHRYLDRNNPRNQLPQDWYNKKASTQRYIISQKIEQSPKVRDYLQYCGEKRIHIINDTGVANYIDEFGGAGVAGKGENRVGNALTARALDKKTKQEIDEVTQAWEQLQRASEYESAFQQTTGASVALHKKAGVKNFGSLAKQKTNASANAPVVPAPTTVAQSPNSHGSSSTVAAPIEPEDTVISGAPIDSLDPSKPIYIYGDLRTSDEVSYSRQAHLLDDAQKKQLLGSKGLPITVAGASPYHFSCAKGLPTARLDYYEASRDGDGPLQKIRVALTIISMIDNVMAKSGKFSLKTQDPFVAAIAKQYLDYLKKEKNIDIGNCKIILRGQPYAATPDAEAAKMFTKVLPVLKQADIAAATHSDPSVPTWEQQVKKDIVEKSSYYRECMGSIRRTTGDSNEDACPTPPTSTS